MKKNNLQDLSDLIISKQSNLIKNLKKQIKRLETIVELQKSLISIHKNKGGLNDKKRT